MRVISGRAKGRKLKAPSRARPLTDRAKEALFNIIRQKVYGCNFLDCFAGSGAVGIEALSRGAKQAVFIEIDRKAVQVIDENLAHTCLADMAQVIVGDTVRVLGTQQSLGRLRGKFDIIFLGAPYENPALEAALRWLGSANLLEAEGIVIAEHRRQHPLDSVFGKLNLYRQERYGETVLAFYEESNLSR